jgi:hypothetical protein
VWWHARGPFRAPHGGAVAYDAQLKVAGVVNEWFYGAFFPTLGTCQCTDVVVVIFFFFFSTLCVLKFFCNVPPASAPSACASPRAGSAPGTHGPGALYYAAIAQRYVSYVSAKPGFRNDSEDLWLTPARIYNHAYVSSGDASSLPARSVEPYYRAHVDPCAPWAGLVPGDGVLAPLAPLQPPPRVDLGRFAHAFDSSVRLGRMETRGSRSSGAKGAAGPAARPVDAASPGAPNPASSSDGAFQIPAEEPRRNPRRSTPRGGTGSDAGSAWVVMICVLKEKFHFNVS